MSGWQQSHDEQPVTRLCSDGLQDKTTAGKEHDIAVHHVWWKATRNRVGGWANSNLGVPDKRCTVKRQCKTQPIPTQDMEM